MNALLEAEENTLSLREIIGSVDDALGRRVSESSIRSYLNLHTPGEFERVARGRYQLVQATEVEADAPVQSTEKPLATVGKAQLYYADSLDWLDQRAESSIHGIITDPPYGLVEYTSREQTKLRAGKGGVWRIPPSFDGHQRSPLPRFTTLNSAEIDNLEIFFRLFGEKSLRVLTPGGHIMIACNPLLSHHVSRAMHLAGLERRGEVIRLVQTMRGGDRPKNAHEEFADVSVMPRSMWEPWLLFRKPIEGTVAQNLRKWKTGGLRRISDDQPFGDVIRSSPTRTAERQIAPHPSLKPQAFLRQVVRAILPLGEGVVLDPFAGSGSTLAAAEAVGYESIGIERDSEYAALATESIRPLSQLQLSGDLSK